MNTFDDDKNDLANPDEYYSKYLLNNNSRDMNVSGTKDSPVVFKRKIPKGFCLILRRGFVIIEHGTTLFQGGDFAGISNGLANGVKIYVHIKDGEKILLEEWKTNRDIRATMYDLDRVSFSIGDYIGRWSFFKDVKNGMLLNEEDEFIIEINDTLSALEIFRFVLKGRLIKNN